MSVVVTDLMELESGNLAFAGLGLLRPMSDHASFGSPAFANDTYLGVDIMGW